MMVGRRSFLFEIRPIFRGVCCYQGVPDMSFVDHLLYARTVLISSTVYVANGRSSQILEDESFNGVEQWQKTSFGWFALFFWETIHDRKLCSLPTSHYDISYHNMGFSFSQRCVFSASACIKSYKPDIQPSKMPPKTPVNLPFYSPQNNKGTSFEPQLVKKTSHIYLR